MKKGRRLKWEDLDPKIQKRWADFRGILSADFLQEWYDKLDRDAESWVADVVKTLRQNDRKKARRVKNTQGKKSQGKKTSVPTRTRNTRTARRKARP